jgi:thiamine transport system ATP-binding protein
MLHVTSLTARFGASLALDSVNLDVADDEIVCVLGPSGSGKSTLLRTIAGLVPDAAGTITFDGIDVTRIPPHRRDFGLMFQDHALFPHRDVIGNVSFGLRMQRLPRADVERRAREALALVGLSGFDHRRVSEISGGEQQRVALARALAPEPKLLMLDEPLGALDRALREHLVMELRALFVRLGLATIFVTHDHDEAFAVADRIVVMHEGRVEQTGTPREVWHRPANAFVAGFLGWNVTRAFGDGLVAVRPEQLRRVTTPRVFGIVTGRVFRRDHFLVQVEVPTDDAALQVAISLDDALPDIGDRIGLDADPAAIVSLPSPALRAPDGSVPPPVPK